MYHFQLNYFGANKRVLNWTLGGTFGGACGVVRPKVIGPCAIFSGFMPGFLSVFPLKRGGSLRREKSVSKALEY